MSTKNPRQRRHYVLAENEEKARTVIDDLIFQGIRPNDVKYLSRSSELNFVRPERVAFIFGPDYERNPSWRTGHLKQKVFEYICDGATKKPVPEIPSKYPEVHVQAGDEGFLPTGGLWDVMSGGTDALVRDNSPALDSPRFRDPGPDYTGEGPVHALTSAPPSGTSTSPATRPSYANLPQLCVGGRFHGQISDAHSMAPGTEIRFVHASGHDTYRLDVFDVLDEKIGFWIHEDIWQARLRHVRDMLLKGAAR